MRLTNGDNPAMITGMSDATVMKVIAETGSDLQNHWTTSKHFVSGWAYRRRINNRERCVGSRRFEIEIAPANSFEKQHNLWPAANTARSVVFTAGSKQSEDRRSR